MRELTDSELKARYTAWQAKKKFAFTNPEGTYPDLHAFFNDGFTAGLEIQDSRIKSLIVALLDEVKFSRVPATATLELLASFKDYYPELSDDFEAVLQL